MRIKKKYPMDGPSLRMQAVALNPKRTKADRIDLSQYVESEKGMREETKRFLTR